VKLQAATVSTASVETVASCVLLSTWNEMRRQKVMDGHGAPFWMRHKHGLASSGTPALGFNEPVHSSTRNEAMPQGIEL
jgi:hypothetical protein